MRVTLILMAVVLLIAGLMNIACFIIGARVGQKASKGEEIEFPNPVKAVQEHRATREQERQTQAEQDRLNTIMENIRNYNGTSAGQSDVPRG